jgi:hypothetical protein
MGPSDRFPHDRPVFPVVLGVEGPEANPRAPNSGKEITGCSQRNGVGKARAALVELPFALWLYLGIEQLPLAARRATIRSRTCPVASSMGCSP